MDKREAIRSFLQDLLRRKGDDRSFTDSESLVLSGRLESVDVLDVVVFLEASFNVDFRNRDFDQTTLDSVDSIVAIAETGS